MSLWSISFAYRLGLGFHALNNEGAEGSNLMQPRRIDVGNVTYDGISGEIIRRHILEHFVDICREREIPMLPLSEGLHPDRGQLGIRQVARQLKVEKLTKANPQDLYRAVREAVAQCAVLDIGGYLAPFSGKEESGNGGDTSTEKLKAVAPEAEAMKNMAELGGKTDGGAPYTVKRDSTFDVAWLISEQPQDLTIGTDDYWYLHPKQNGKDIERFAIESTEQRKRQITLIEAIANFIASPTGAKVAGWAPHVFLTEGVILLSSNRTAPFVSPVKVCLDDNTHPVQANLDYIESMKNLADNQELWAWYFGNTKGLLESVKEVVKKLRGEQ